MTCPKTRLLYKYVTQVSRCEDENGKTRVFYVWDVLVPNRGMGFVGRLTIKVARFVSRVNKTTDDSFPFK